MLYECRGVTRVTEMVADPRDHGNVPFLTYLSQSLSVICFLLCPGPWEVQDGIERTVGSCLKGLAVRGPVGSIVRGGPTAHSRAVCSRCSSDDTCEPSSPPSRPVCLSFLIQEQRQEWMAKGKGPLRSLDSWQLTPKDLL